MPLAILMLVHVLNAVQTKHGGEFGQKAAQERNKSWKPARSSSLMAKNTKHQAGIGGKLVSTSVVAAVGTSNREGEAMQLQRLWTPRS